MNRAIYGHIMRRRGQTRHDPYNWEPSEEYGGPNNVAPYQNQGPRIGDMGPSGDGAQGWSLGQPRTGIEEDLQGFRPSQMPGEVQGMRFMSAKRGPSQADIYDPQGPPMSAMGSAGEAEDDSRNPILEDRAGSFTEEGAKGQGKLDIAAMVLQKKRQEEESARERRRQVLSGMRSIAEGAGNWNIKSPINDRLVGSMDEPYVAEQIREEQSQLESELTPAERDFLKVPEGRARAGVVAKGRGVASLDWQREKEDRIEDRFRRSQELREGAIDEAGRRREDTNERYEDSAKYKMVQDYRKDAAEYRTMIRAASTAKIHLDQKTSTGDNAAITAIARLAGESGALSRDDVHRYMQRMGFLNKWKDWLAQGVNGMFSDEQRSELRQVVASLEAERIRALNEDTERFVRSNSGRFGMSEQDVMDLVSPQTDAELDAQGSQEPQGQSGEGDMVPMVDPEGTTWSVHRSEVEDAIQNGWRVDQNG